MGSCISTKIPSSPNLDVDNLLVDATIKNIPYCTYDFNRAKVIKVYDGDSVTIAAKYFNKICKFEVRIVGIDCDEIKGGTSETKYNGKLAKSFVTDMILNKIVDIGILNGRVFEGKVIKEKYGRLLAVIKVDGKSVADELIRVGLARPYNGGTKDTTPLVPKLQ
jgi:micrococcal nuclease